MKLTGKHYGIILSTLATALLHLSLFPNLGSIPIFLNGFGYLALLGAYFLLSHFFNRGINWSGGLSSAIPCSPLSYG